uniref:Reverse transcriptase domain-containing protein n=1 Tax=Angiostrongylus cantonensis TaxID=6313 RepID=A0A0K0DAW9_ANGCA
MERRITSIAAVVCLLVHRRVMTLSSNDAKKIIDIKVKVEDAEPDGRQAQQSLNQRTALDSGPSVARVAGLSNKFLPRYLIRAPTDTSPTPLKRIAVSRPTPPDWKVQCTERRKEIEPVQQSPNHCPVKKIVSPEKDRSVKLWRTPTGKLVRLGGKPPVDPSRHSLRGLVSSSRPKFIRLSNGKLARITTKRVPSSSWTSSPSSNRTTGHLIVGSGKVDAASLKAKITSRSGPIDISTLLGDAPVSNDNSKLDNNQISKPIKTEPMDLDEAVEPRELQKCESSSDSRRAGKPSPSVTLSGVNSHAQVGELVKPVGQPLFNDEIRANSFGKNCSICRTTLPAMKRNLLSLEARLGTMVEIVQNLLTNLNPHDRKIVELTKTIGSHRLSNGDIKDATVIATASSSATTGPVSYRTTNTSGLGYESEKPSSCPSPIAIKADKLLESRNNEAGPNGGPQCLYPVHSEPLPSIVSLKEQSVSSPRCISVLRGPRFILADRASALRTVYSSNAMSEATKNGEVESSMQRKQITIKIGEDVKPDTGSISSDANVKITIRL